MCESINRKRWIPTTRKELNQERAETSTRTTKLWESSRQTRQSIRVKAAICTLWVRVEVEMTSASRLDINHRRWMILTPNPRLKTLRARKTFQKLIFINQPKITCKLGQAALCQCFKIQKQPTRSLESSNRLLRIHMLVWSEKQTKIELRLFWMLFSPNKKSLKCLMISGPRYKYLRCMTVTEAINVRSTWKSICTITLFFNQIFQRTSRAPFSKEPKWLTTHTSTKCIKNYRLLKKCKIANQEVVPIWLWRSTMICMLSMLEIVELLGPKTTELLLLTWVRTTSLEKKANSEGLKQLEGMFTKHIRSSMLKVNLAYNKLELINHQMINIRWIIHW